MQNPYHPLSLGLKLSDFVVYKEFITYMKKTKIIIPALGLLLLSTAASVTGTVAWFAMNASVSATGMQITAKSNSVFLLIGNENSLSTIQTANSVTTALTVDAESAKVYPSAHDTIANTAAATATDVSHTFQYQEVGNTSNKISIEEYANLPASAEGAANDKSEFEAEARNGTNWYYKVANLASASASTYDPHYLQTVDAAYIIHKTCYVCMSAGSEDGTGLKVKSMAIASNGTATGGDATITPVKVLITSSTAAVELDSATTSSSTVLASTVTDDALIALDIFIYYNGADTDVYTNNMANLDGATVNLTFSVGE